ncbi:MAG: 16S rRNA (uracil(1498)-N(3))-methyltransferase [Gammaproteobacteria bacterium]|jgi:16S rRNA (uracil1498-N3)-methyltransferase|nr:16S rRNA (uracil(1498)-N(3))-methyltransferase [Gammaproteobacteria bacterium]MBT4607855.1 16S rRNA (uracil(1498)-N(3))-methyltransferase [Thiotrichales bacterium]MBT3471246.1 16S rRNA (uracil(1498)-N(3))-methyltransferase [Gammaproteobacteria bacterium]MBT3966301.1 16S rRNA (uracil(1498)-N(3))-methyltransferase [Gammaproteobacteria bacterium]MBT4079796.1 16S rRNA (uracil(1498)-N(3))-methyltransferase [Gammaproteobacteria bacterium]
MAIPRIYSRNPLHAEQSITLDEAAQRHVIQVLRLKTGASITLFDGSGNEFESTIEQIERKKVTVSLQAATPRDCESPIQTHLYQGISKGERMDYAIQKATELGVNSITPLFCERTVLKLEPKRLQKKVDHWQAVAISACEQSGRNHVPQLLPPQSLQQLKPHSGSTGMVLNPYTEQRLGELPEPHTSLSILIGPEGGLSEAEIYNAETLGWHSIKLGPRILRTETATVVALTALQQLWGDL